MRRSILISLFTFLCVTACTNRAYHFARFSTNVGLDYAEDAGLFEPRTVTLNTSFEGDTLFFYDGIFDYYVRKDSIYIKFTVYPSRSAAEDTIHHYLKKLKKIDPVKEDSVLIKK